MATDKRTNQRHKILVPVSCKSETNTHWPSWVLTKDVSQNGFCFETDSAIAKGTRLTIEIEIPGRLFLINAVGHVKWMENITHSDRTNASTKNEIGIQVVFSQPLDAKVWKRFIQRSILAANIAN